MFKPANGAISIRSEPSCGAGIQQLVLNQSVVVVHKRVIHNDMLPTQLPTRLHSDLHYACILTFECQISAQLVKWPIYADDDCTSPPTSTMLL